MGGQNAEAWYPPGHGDIYASLANSGLLDQLIAEGKEYVFVSNIDNLGATVDLHILHHLMSQPAHRRCEFVMEVTDKTRADVKVGGAKAASAAALRALSTSCFLSAGWHPDPVRGPPEAAGDRPGPQGPRGRVQVRHQVQDLQHQQPVDLAARHPEAAGPQGPGHGDHRQPQGKPRPRPRPHRHLVCSRRSTGPRTSLQTLDGGLNVIQLETAVGAGIKSFSNAMGVNVPRSRFLPVKTSSDLLLVMSNLYSLDAGSLTMSKKREFPTTPHVKLGSSFTNVSGPGSPDGGSRKSCVFTQNLLKYLPLIFGSAALISGSAALISGFSVAEASPSILQVQEFLSRFDSIPDMLELDHLTVSGDVTFGKNVSLKVRTGSFEERRRLLGGAWLLTLVCCVDAGNRHHHRQPRRPDRYPGRSHAGEQDRLREPAHPRPLRHSGKKAFHTLFLPRLRPLSPHTLTQACY